MNKPLWNSIAVALLLLANNTFGYFYHGRVMKRAKGSRQQYIILLCDYHDKVHPANKTQRVLLEQFLQRCAAAKGKLIVEDLSSVNNDGRMICCNYGINSCEGVLGHLANKARELGMCVDNVEYRYCRVAGIGPLLNNITSNPHSFRSSAGITTVSLHQEVLDEIEKIKKYDDGKRLNAFYKRIVSEVCSMLSKMGLHTTHKKNTVAHYCSALEQGNYREQLEKLCIFDSALIDINIMHSIARCDRSLILVVAGGSHIEKVSKLLQKMGYQSLFTTPDSSSPQLIKASQASSTSSQTCPQPIDISVLDRFIR